MTQRPRHSAPTRALHADLVWLVSKTAYYRISLTYLAIGVVIVVALALLY